jgi:hypothetical protein
MATLAQGSRDLQMIEHVDVQPDVGARSNCTADCRPSGGRRRPGLDLPADTMGDVCNIALASLAWMNHATAEIGAQDKTSWGLDALLKNERMDGTCRRLPTRRGAVPVESASDKRLLP